MSGFLLDTNVVSEDIRPQPDPGVVAFLTETTPTLLYISVLTLGEIRKGIAALAHGRRKTQLENWLDTQLRAHMGLRILPVTSAIAERWGVLHVEAARKGRPLAAIDGLLAATALEHNLTLVSRNARDFAPTHALVFNPWA